MQAFPCDARLMGLLCSPLFFASVMDKQACPQLSVYEQLCLVQTILDHVDDVGEFLREVLAELRIVIFLNVGEFLLPAFHINLRDFRESFLIVVSETVSVEGLR